MKISAAIIGRSPSEYVRGCLQSLRGQVDQIIYIETGPASKMPPELREVPCRAYSYVWLESFSDARNYALKKCNHPWILIIDTDERLVMRNNMLLGEVAGRLEQQTEEGKRPLGVCQVISPTTYADGSTGMSMTSLARLIPNEPDLMYTGLVHERLTQRPFEEGRLFVDITELRIVHLGYDTEAGEQIAKAQRNLRLLEKQLTMLPAQRGETWYNMARVHSWLGNKAEQTIALAEARKHSDLPPKIRLEIDILLSQS